MKTAVVIGSTGLIGKLLLEKLVQNMDYQQILAIVRNKAASEDHVYQHPKVRCLAFDFHNWTELSMQVEGFAGNKSITFFCCLGTTMAIAKSEEAFRRVDHNYI